MKTPDNEYQTDPPQDAIETTEMKERSHKIIKLKQNIEGLLDSLDCTTSSYVKMQIVGAIQHLRGMLRDLEDE